MASTLNIPDVAIWRCYFCNTFSNKEWLDAKSNHGSACIGDEDLFRLNMDNESDGSLSTTHLLDLPNRGKIPVLPGVSQVYHTTRLSEKLFQSKSNFDLTDPNGYLLRSEYSILNDPNLKGFLHRKDIRQRLFDSGLITKDDRVICSLKHLNQYKDHLADVELDWGRRFRAEQKVLVRRFLTLQEGGKVPETVTLSDVTEWILGRAKNSFCPSKQLIQQRMCNSSCELEGSSILRLPNIAITNSLVKINCCPSATCRSQKVWNAKGRQILQEVTKEVRREMRLERRFEQKEMEKLKKRAELRQKKSCLIVQKKACHLKTATGSREPVSSSERAMSHPVNAKAPTVEPKAAEKIHLSSSCRDLVVEVTQSSIASAYNLDSSFEKGMARSVSTIATHGSLFGHAGSLQSITNQLSDIEQRLQEEHLKGTITNEELYLILHGVVTTVVEEVNGILIPAMMAFEYDQLRSCTGSSAFTSDDNEPWSDRSYLSPSQQPSSRPQSVLVYRQTPPSFSNGTWALTTPCDPKGDALSLSLRHGLLSKVESLIQKVITGEAEKLDAECDSHDDLNSITINSSHKEKAKENATILEATSRDAKDVIVHAEVRAENVGEVISRYIEKTRVQVDMGIPAVEGNSCVPLSRNGKRSVPPIGTTQGAPFISLLRSIQLSSDKVDEVLDKVIEMLTEERHLVIFGEELQGRPSTQPLSPHGSRPSNEPLCSVSAGQPLVQLPGEDTSCKLLGGKSIPMQSLGPLLSQEQELLDKEIILYANSIINILMETMAHDNELYEPVPQLKTAACSPRLQTGTAFLSPNPKRSTTTIPAIPGTSIPVIRVIKQDGPKSVPGGKTNVMPVVRWILHTILKRHGWLGQANLNCKQDKDNHHLCEFIEMLLVKLNQRYAAALSTGYMPVPTLIEALNTDGTHSYPPNSFKRKLHEATIGPISYILEHMSSRFLRSRSCPILQTMPRNPLIQRSSMTNLWSYALNSALASDISACVAEKLSDALRCFNNTNSMTNLQDFIKAMTNGPTGESQHGFQRFNVDFVSKEVLDIVVSKLKSFVTQGPSYNARQDLAEKIAESCLEIEYVFTEILQTLKSSEKTIDACSSQEVDTLATALSDTMFKRVRQGSASQRKDHLDSMTEVSASHETESALEIKKDNSTIETSSLYTKEKLPCPDSLNVKCQGKAQDVFLPKSCERDVSTVCSLGRPNLLVPRISIHNFEVETTCMEQPSDYRCQSNPVNAKISNSSCQILKSTVEKFARKLMDECVASKGTLYTHKAANQDGAETECHMKQQNPQRDVCTLTSREHMHSKRLQDEQEKPLPAEKICTTNMLSTSGPISGQDKNSQMSKIGRCAGTIQAAKRVPSSMSLDNSNIKIEGSSITQPKCAGSRSNTSLVATDITEDLVCRLLLGEFE